MPPSGKLEIKSSTYREKPLLYRKNHLNLKFVNFFYGSPDAVHLLDAHFGANRYGLFGKPVGTWASLWTDVPEEEFLSKVQDLNKALRNDSPDAFAEPDLVFQAIRRTDDEFTDETSPDFQWALKSINIFQAWDIQTGTDQVIIGHLDSGIPLKGDGPYEKEAPVFVEGMDHPDLKGYRFIAGMDLVKDQRWPIDDSGSHHGTHLAGILAAESNNNQGMAGINWASPVFAFKALHQDYEGMEDQPHLYSTGANIHLGILETVEYAASLTPSPRVVINLSQEFPNETVPDYTDGTLKAIFNLVIASKAIICIGAGNTGELREPSKTGLSTVKGYSSSVIVTGAIDREEAIWVDSPNGYDDMVFAPGVGILSTHESDGTDIYYKSDGTSYAAPHAAALASLMWSEAPQLDATDIVRILKSTCRYPDITGDLTAYGKGIIDAYAALKELKTQVCLVLDRSGSMDTVTGPDEKTRLEILQEATGHLVDKVDAGSSLATIAFNDVEDLISPMTVISDPEIVGPEEPEAGGGTISPVRESLKEAISGLAAEGGTSIALGVLKARSQLGSDKVRKAIIVVSDGKETADPRLSTVPAGAGDIVVYSIGMGTPEDMEPTGLMALTAGTGGYMIHEDQLFSNGSNAISKFLTQIEGEISGYEPVVDPALRFRAGDRQSISFLLGAHDWAGEIVLINPGNAPLSIELKTPAGKLMKDSEISATRNGDVTRYRFRKPNFPPQAAKGFRGEWSVEVSLPEDRYGEWLDGLGEDRDEAAAFANEGFPCTLVVQARSRLKMKCRIKQSSYEPGAVMTLRVDLDQDRKPVRAAEVVTVQVTTPDKKVISPAPDKRKDGAMTWSATADTPGIYRWLVSARGTLPGGDLIQREFRLTGAVWEASSQAGDGTPGLPGQPGLPVLSGPDGFKKSG